MAEERNTHVKLAMAEVFACFAIAWIAFVLAMFGLKIFDDTGTILVVSYWVGIGLLVATVVAYVNENNLLVAILGPLAIFFLAFPKIAEAGLTSGDMAAGTYTVMFVGIILLVDALLSLMQPIKILPVLLFLAAALFFVVGMWWSDMSDTNRMLVGVFGLLVFIVATYIGAAVLALTIKGKPIIPLLITK